MQLGDEVEAAFWAHFRSWGLGQGFAHAAYAAERLLKFGRSAAALELLNLYLRKDETGAHAELIATALDQFLDTGDKDPEARLLDRHDFSMLFEYLQSSDLDWRRLAQLEWAYAAVLDFEHRLQTLERLMSTEPQVFVDMIIKLFRPKADQGKEHGPVSEEQERVATNAYRVLSHRTRVPGTADDGSINADELRRWVMSARNLLSAADRVEIGDVYIGHALAHAAPDADGAWPPKAIRDLLEELQNDKIEDGLVVQTLNNREVTSRGVTEGGVQERVLATKFRDQAHSVADQWPRSARVLNRLADSYERDARQMDEDAERLKKGLSR